MRRGVGIFAAVVTLVGATITVVPAHPVVAASSVANGLIVWEQNADLWAGPQIWVMNPDGTNQTQLTDFGSNGTPAWSPDGTKIAFSTNRDGNGEIYVMNADGSDPTRVTVSSASDFGPTWSPDGTQLAFASMGATWNYDIHVINLDGTGDTNITNDPAEDVLPAWQPGGSKIAFLSNRAGNHAIFTVNSDGTDLTNLSALSATGASIDWDPEWSPDGAKLAFSRWENYVLDIYTMNPDGTGVTQITTGGRESGPAWSPDGSRMAFMSFRDYNDELYVMNIDGSGQTRLTNNAAPGNTLPEDRAADWQPLVFTNVLPEGTHDGATERISINPCYANGWASDPNDRSVDLSVRVLSDDVEIWSGVAGEFRQDLLDAGIGDGTAAFWVGLEPLVSADVAHEIRVQAQDAQTAEWVDLDATPRTITCSGLWGSHDGNRGTVDRASCAAGGWAYDADTPTGPRVQVRIRVDGKIVAETTADEFREDVRDAGFGDGYSGYTVNLFGKLTPGRPHIVSVEARDTGLKRVWVPLRESDLELTCLAH